ncbi:phosphoribosyl 1,2-cyclic phosphodiesterase [Larkinella arboricola]|uniref:Phosphoribosyl 1,2-cyclic phosphodiesterase n=1 Tax=Larkinella arboricola TaxID=643671 RepID=A0A327WQT7_LARAB|nr:MBL fold metallo-hydrolase [Larkinella arboricola]RAJ94349.1 phosphoribosyl 1,2-cyclic phosphodiesterase [Larkinella arboricola]
MSLFISSLNSGSNGNCYYVGNEQEAVLIDAGISCRQAETRLRRLGLPIRNIKAVFISHEHSDHISGLSQLAGKYQLPVFITPETLQNTRLVRHVFPIRPFSSHEPVQIGDLSITAFPKYHDAADPHSFMISCRGTNVGVFTDIGVPCDQLIHHFSQCHAAFLETNYDEEMLAQGRYPYFLKQRIRGGKGHLSNQQALDLFRAHKPAFMSHVLLAHLSKDNNCPQLVRDLFLPHLNTTELIVASRNEETPVFRIGAN